MVEEELHTRVINGLVGTINHALQHQVGFLELIVEEEIVVGELNGNRVAVTMSEIGPQHVEARVHPASPARPLVVDRLLGRLDAEVGVRHLVVAVVAGKVVDGICRHGVADGLVGIGRRGGDDLAHHVGADASLGAVLGRAGKGEACQQCKCDESVHIM